MAYAITHFWPGGTQEQYERELKALHPADGSLPAGQLFHAAGTTEGGVFIIAVHESKESWETFRDQVVIPMSAQVVDGFPAPPVERDVELFHVFPDHILGD
jgi:hypothetical protein